MIYVKYIHIEINIYYCRNNEFPALVSGTPQVVRPAAVRIADLWGGPRAEGTTARIRARTTISGHSEALWF